MEVPGHRKWEDNTSAIRLRVAVFENWRGHKEGSAALLSCVAGPVLSQCTLKKRLCCSRDIRAQPDVDQAHIVRLPCRKIGGG